MRMIPLGIASNQIVDERARGDLEDSDAPEVLQTLFRKFFDQREKYDSASKDQVRKHFAKWCASDAAKA